jgi:transcriptional regulator with XRE-family HTH domain
MYEIFEKLLMERGVTAYKVAKATGISTGSMTDWKKGRSAPKVDKLQKIADYFGVSVDYLLGNEPKEKTPAEADVTFDDFTYAMYGEAKELTDEDKNMLLEMARMLKKRQQEGK